MTLSRWPLRAMKCAAMSAIVGSTFLVGTPLPGFWGNFGVVARVLVWATYCALVLGGKI